MKGLNEMPVTESGKEKDERCNEGCSNDNVNFDEPKTEKTKLKKIDKLYLIDSCEDAISSKGGAGTSCWSPSAWRTSAVAISWFSIFVTFAIGITEFVVAKAEDSSAAFGLAFDATLDVLTSAVVLWRFYKADDTFSKAKEHIACVVLGVLFIISSIGIATKAIVGLSKGDTPDLSEYGIKILVVTSSLTTIICFLLFITKVIIAKNLSSWTILTDAFNSLVGGIIALSMVVTSEVTISNPALWFLDSIVGLSVCVFLGIFGIWLLVQHIPKTRHSQKNQENK